MDKIITTGGASPDSLSSNESASTASKSASVASTASSKSASVASTASSKSASVASRSASKSASEADGSMEDEKSGFDINELLNQQRARSDLSPSSIALNEALTETVKYQDETFDDLVETLHENIGELSALSQLPVIKSYNSACIRNMANWSKIDKFGRPNI